MIALLFSLFLLLGNAFFVAAEFSMVSVRRSAIEPLAAKGSKRAKATLKALENISFLMAGAQLGITLCSLALGAVAEPAIAHLIEKPFDLEGPLLHAISFTIALVITVFAHVVIGEMVPKNIALAKPERSALILTPLLVAVVKLFNPIVHALNWCANMILRIFNVHVQPEVASSYTRDEMADLVTESRREGYLSEDNEQLLSGALSFDRQTVQSSIIPLTEIITINQQTTYEQAEELAATTGFSRFPMVIDGQMTGYVHIKDAIKARESQRKKAIQPIHIRQLAQVQSTQSIRMTLKIMQRSGAHIALVNNGKKILGVVALEDVLEELVGEMSSFNTSVRS